MRKQSFSLVFGCVLSLSACRFWLPATAPNPDHRHTHADFAVWVGDRKADFNRPEWMSGSSKEAPAGGHGDDDHKHPYLHLHDGNGHLIHRHKPGLSIGTFFASLGLDMTPECFQWDSDHRDCNREGQRWRMFVHGEEVPVDPGYVFADGDNILLTYDTGDMRIEEQLRQMTDDACLYSQTCPRRGKPPTENCIADPAVPCTE